MAQQTINVGASPNDGTGTPLRTAFQYTNSNFSELYTAVGPSGNNIVVPGSATITGNLTLNGGTANGIPYLNASKVVTTSDKLSFANTPGFFDSTLNINSLLGSALYRGGITISEDDVAFTLFGGSGYKLIQTSGFSTPNQLRFYASNVEQYRIGASGVFNWYDGAGGTRMTLNSTGLLVGTTSDLTGANISSSKGLGTANIATNRFATVEYGSGAGGAFTTITVSFTVANTVTSVIIEALLTGFSGVYLDHVAARYSTQSPVVIRNNASAGTTAAALAVDGTGLIYTLTITTSVQNPVIKVKATAGGLSGSITLPVITFA